MIDIIAILNLLAVAFFAFGMAGYPCCCVCCPHCDPKQPRVAYTVTVSAPTVRESGDCCDDQTACDLFGGTYTLDWMGKYTACAEDYNPCGYWQSEPFEIACEEDEENPSMAIAILTFHYEPGTDLCVYYFGIGPADRLENEPCNLTALCRPDCTDDNEYMYAVWTFGFDETTDCEEVDLAAVCNGNYCMDWPGTVTIIKDVP